MAISVAALGPGLRQSPSLLFCHSVCQMALVTFSTSLHLCLKSPEDSTNDLPCNGTGGFALALQTQHYQGSYYHSLRCNPYWEKPSFLPKRLQEFHKACPFVSLWALIFHFLLRAFVLHAPGSD